MSVKTAAALTPWGCRLIWRTPWRRPLRPLPSSGDARGGARVSVRGLSKMFEHGGRVIEVLRGLNFELAPGEIASVVGASGVGKSTLLQVLGTLDAPTAGTITFDGVDVTAHERPRGWRSSGTARSASCSSSTTSCPSSPPSRTR